MQQGMIVTVFILFLLKEIRGFNYSQIPSRNNALPFSRFNRRSSPIPFNRQVEQHLCIIECSFIIPFGEPLVLPSSCRRQLTSNACDIAVELIFHLNFTAFIFVEETIDLIIEDVRLNTSSTEIIGFEFDDNQIFYSLGYKCAIGNECEWNYMKEKIPDLITTDFETLYNSLLPLIYNGKSQSNVSQCYTRDELTECLNGMCDYTQVLDENTFTLTSIRECLIFERPKIYFGGYRYTPSPTKYDFDYLYFACNINQCNSPSNEMAIKRLIGFIDDKNVGLIKTGSLSVVFQFWFIIYLFVFEFD